MGHNGEAPFKCKQCDFSSVRENDLKQHTLTKHTGFVVECGQCEFTSSYPHKLKHTGERPLKCDECDHTSTQKSHFIATSVNCQVLMTTL